MRIVAMWGNSGSAPHQKYCEQTNAKFRSEHGHMGGLEAQLGFLHGLAWGQGFYSNSS